MAEPNYVGIAMGLDVTDLKEGLAETQKAIRTAGKEFDNAVADMDDWKKSSEGLTAKLKQLDTVLEAQKKAYQGIKAELEEAKKKYGENSEQVRKLNDQLLDADTKVKKTEKSIRQYKKALDDLTDSTEEATSETKKLEKAQDGASASSSKLGEGFTVLKGAIANIIANGIQNLISTLKNVSEQTRQFRKELSILDNAFLETGHTTDTARKYFVELNSVLGDTGKTEEALLHLAELCDNEEELTSFTNILIGVYSKFGNTLPVEGLAETINHTVKLGKVQGNLADALEWTGTNVDDFNLLLAECNTESERADLIRETLNGKYEEASKIYKQNNADLIDAQKAETEYQLAMVELGKVMTPIITEFTKAMKFFIEMVTGFVNWFKKNAPIIVSLLAGIAVGIIALNMSSIITALSGAFTVLTTKIKLANATLMANPIVLIVSLITMLIVYIGYLWATNEDFRNGVIGVFNDIKAGFEELWNLIVGGAEAIGNSIGGIGDAFGEMWNTLTESFANIGNFFGELVDKFVQLGKDVIDGMIQGMKDAVGSIGDVIGDIGNGIVDGFKGVLGIHSPSKVMKDEIGKMMGLGIAEGLTDSLEDINVGIKDFGKGVDVSGVTGSATGSVVNNFNQTINAPKEPSRLELYRQTKNLLNYYGGGA